MTKKTLQHIFDLKNPKDNKRWKDGEFTLANDVLGVIFTDKALNKARGGGRDFGSSIRTDGYQLEFIKERPVAMKSKMLKTEKAKNHQSLEPWA